MNFQTRINAMEELTIRIDCSETSPEFYSEDVIRRVHKRESLIGRDAVRQQTEEYPGRLASPQMIERRMLTIDDEKLKIESEPKNFYRNKVALSR